METRKADDGFRWMECAEEYGGGGEVTRQPGSVREEESLRTDPPVDVELVAVLDCLDGVRKPVPVRIIGRDSGG